MYPLIRPLLFKLDAEQAHHLSMRTAETVQAVSPHLVAPLFHYENDRLAQTVWGRRFANPVGLAAGFDKDAKLIPFWRALGFGFVEAGSVSARPAPGNPRPRAFRLPLDRALVNRMGLNNEGAAAVAARIHALGLRRPLPLGLNLAKTHDPAILGEAAVADFRESFRLLAPLADYVALNISCPNTAEGKTFEAPDALEALLEAIFADRTALGLTVPVLLKLSPPASQTVDPDALAPTIALAQAYGVHGFIATNTASDRAGLHTDEAQLHAIGRGGLSGDPLAGRSTALIRHLYQATEGALPIIGVGGVASAAAA
ncbi:MAG: quinone-dependent dihydroorotate dehydrogenase, partial [Bacteroidota bacterium]